MSNSNHHINVIKKEYTASVNPQETLSAVKSLKNQVVLSGVDANTASVSKINSCAVNDEGELKVKNDDITVGNDNTLSQAQQVVLYGKDYTYNNLHILQTSTTGKLEIDNNVMATSNTKLDHISDDLDLINTKMGDGTQKSLVLGANDINGGTPHRHMTIDANGRTLTNPLMTTTNTKLDSVISNTNDINTKITQGEGDIAGGGSGLQQILCYGKDQSGNLDPLNVDNNGHLKITINDIESGITNSINVVDSHLSDDLDAIKRTKSSTTPVNNETVALAGTYTSSAIDLRTATHFGIVGTATGAFDINLTVSDTSSGTYYKYATGSIDANNNIVNSTSAGVPPISPVSYFPFKYMKIEVENQDSLYSQTITLKVFKIQ